MSRCLFGEIQLCPHAIMVRFHCMPVRGIDLCPEPCDEMVLCEISVIRWMQFLAQLEKFY